MSASFRYKALSFVVGLLAGQPLSYRFLFVLLWSPVSFPVLLMMYILGVILVLWLSFDKYIEGYAVWLRSGVILASIGFWVFFFVSGALAIAGGD